MTLRCVSIKPGTMSAEDLRNAFAALLEPASADKSMTGYVPGAVPTVTVSGMAVTATAFRGWVQGTSTQAAYAVVNDGNVTVTLSDGGSQDRIDTIVARIRNKLYDSSGFDDAEIVAIEGTAASSPVAPSIGPTDLVIADVRVPANADSGSGLVAANVDYSRQQSHVVALGGIHVARQNDPDGAYAGQWRDDAGVLERWNGSLWIPLRAFGVVDIYYDSSQRTYSYGPFPTAPKVVLMQSGTPQGRSSTIATGNVTASSFAATATANPDYPGHVYPTPWVALW